jgi:serine protease Do/serine protease DegQ
MKSFTCLPRIVAGLVVLAAALSAGAATPKSSRTPPPKAPKPAVKIDRSAVGEGPKGGPVVSYADIVEPAQKAVVSVYSTKIIKERLVLNPLFRRFFGNIPDQERESRQEGMGSGVIVTSDGYILTNNHVVEGADEVKVTLADDRDFVAKVIGADPKTDVAVLKIEGEGLPFVTLADSDRLRVGDIVFAVGNPLGVGQTVTMGIVSAKGRSKLGLLENVSGYEDFIQTDAAINMGNSGGALLDARGRLVGINSAIISPSRGNIGIGLAIPINLASFIMNSLVENGVVARGFLGISSDTLTGDVAEQLGLKKETRGAVITDVEPDGPADKAGIKATDVVIALNNHPVTTSEELRLLISQVVPDAKATLRIARDGKERTVEVRMGQAIENPNEFVEGVTVTTLTPELKRRFRITDPRINGLLITEVAETSPYADRLARGLILIQVNRERITDLQSARALLRPRPERNLLTIFDGLEFRYVSIVLR